MMYQIRNCKKVTPESINYSKYSAIYFEKVEKLSLAEFLSQFLPQLQQNYLTSDETQISETHYFITKTEADETWQNHVLSTSLFL